MAAPAAIFVAIAGSDPALLRGWAIPAATDIAFALGVLAIVGRGLPPSLRLFLLSVAIVDDLGAIVVIALFYTAKIKLMWLAAAALVLGMMLTLNRLAVERGWPFVLLALALWYCILHSGIHATIAGVLAALTIPLKVGRRSGDSMLLRFEHALVPLNGYLIVPIFGFANAGVSLAGPGLAVLIDPLPVAIAAGLVLGKQIGIFGSVALAERLGIASRPNGASWLQLWGVSMLCGMGFTMSLFIGSLAFPEAPQLFDQARIGVLAGTAVSALLGMAVLWLAPRHERIA
jgi:Na+:H+ antiporter, NhaA family